jgi:hypothetical protein
MSHHQHRACAFLYLGLAIVSVLALLLDQLHLIASSILYLALAGVYASTWIDFSHWCPFKRRH